MKSLVEGNYEIIEVHEIEGDKSNKLDLCRAES